MSNDFIPKMYKKKQVSIRVPYERLEQIDGLAAQYGVSRTDFIMRCIEYAVEHMPAIGDDKNQAEGSDKR